MGELNLPINPLTLENDTKQINQIAHFSELTASSGAQQLKISKEGLVIGTTVIVDSQGLNSLNNFISDRITDIPTFETSSTSYVDVTGGTMTPLILTREAKVLFYLNVIGRNNTINDSEEAVGYLCGARIYDADTGGTKAQIDFKGGLGFKYTFGSPDSYASSVTSVSHCKVIIDSVPAGTHTFKYQLKATGGGVARSFDADIGYVVLGI